ncbi:MAG: hypothetical protein E7260_06240 [Lachnospiraceae bacterium]|nr:hypothetical protein [Lachnospiraceae bacterium]
MNGKKGEMKLIVSFIERGQGNGLTKFYTEHHVSFNYHSVGIGTASSDLLDVLGIGSSEKDVIFSLAARENAERLMDRLSDNLRNIREKGIVFTMPLTGLNNVVATVLERQVEGGRMGGNEMDANVANSLILVMINQGNTDAVMNTARAAGARGGTIIRSRFTGPEDVAGLENMMAEEKEIIAMVVPTDKRNAIMDTINKKHGIKTEAGAVILSLGIDRIAKLG